MRRYIIALAAFTALPATAQTPEMALWRLDCGRIVVNDLNMFSDTLDYSGKSKELTDSCYLIRHDDSYMLWDAGLPAAMLGAENDPAQPAVPILDRLLTDQLAEIGVTADQISTIGISHNHFDHLGQAADFPQARLLIGALDWQGLQASPPSYGADPALVQPWLDAGKVEPVHGDLDIFGDGSAMMLTMPGHTAGETALLLRLPETGPVLLSGDVAHFTEQLANERVPPINFDRADSLAAMDRLRDVAASTGATIVIQHEPADIAKLPAFPDPAR
ncbi:N-acyl homoserine lactonase family protein [Paracoccus aurantiacus]|uniref:N-acyl homoserine lactonase family protein n=1 Tax=Paracoccus aurantiacus TaxID=2599412 RepID=A0A5C6S3W7_9RHOB|nr:N-acyl homoserine lactonase family protein [Paracoccus aurantiacus]TXB68977.1 N-acyl homoserine lactonase family protein [Paracoccus aurantiacus]